MALPKINPTKTKSWHKLQQFFKNQKNISIQEHFENEAKRVEDFKVVFDNIYLDFSKNRVSKEVFDTLIELAKEVQLEEAIQAQFNGKIINETENRAVLHTALRSSENNTGNTNNVKELISSNQDKIREFVDQLENKKWKGYTNKTITDVVNIGIGGSDLGPQMVVEALKFYQNDLNTHFISNVDGDHVAETLKGLNPETTLCIVVSKSFTTQETLTNATSVRNWFLQQASQDDIKHHFVAVSANVNKAIEFGVAKDNVFPMWDWVGGRFSLWSSAGLSIACSIGFANFDQILVGANKMDVHFKKEEFSKNIPVILALLSIWYNNFYQAESEAVIPYTQYLTKLAPYLQQAIMESNGKGIDRNGKVVDYQTGNVVWGEPGTNAQHAFFQLLHQGTKLIPADFIGFKQSLHGLHQHHDILMANFFAQTQALMNGKTDNKVQEELHAQGLSKEEITKLKPYKIFTGNRPTNTILLDKLTPHNLGLLLATYEHKIFVQGVIWNIFSFDQWGVELGKQLANRLLQDFNTNNTNQHDASTQNLIKLYNT